MIPKISLEFTEDELELTMLAVSDSYNESDRQSRVAVSQAQAGYPNKEALIESGRLWREEADIELRVAERLRAKLTEMRQAK